MLECKNMEREVYPESLLSASQILSLISRMLLQLNPALGKISVQSAFIAGAIVRNGDGEKTLSLKDSLLISLLHLVGFYHFNGEKTTKLSDFTAEEINHAYLYGYYYLKEMSPLGDVAKTLLFHDKKYDSELAARIKQIEYASLLFSARGIQSLVSDTEGSYVSSDFENYGFSKYNQRYVTIYRKLDISKLLTKKLKYDSFLSDLDEWFAELSFTKEETWQLLRLLVYIMDFKSTQTVQHIIHTAGYAYSIGKLMGCTKQEADELYTAGLLHDLGKVAIPNVILEFAGTLSAFEYRVMQMHVEETENLLQGVVEDKILQIASRHHEKLNGSGYPNRLTEKDLTIQQRLMTVADIFSALIDKRSYKEKMQKDQIIALFTKMANAGEIGKNIPQFLESYFEEIWQDMEDYGVLLSVPLGKVEIQYQEELSNELEEFGEN